MRFSGKLRFVASELGDTIQLGDACTVDVSFDPQTEPVSGIYLPWYPTVKSTFTIHASGGDLIASSTEGPQEFIIITDRTGADQSDTWVWAAMNFDASGDRFEGFEPFEIEGFEIRGYIIHLTDNTATAFTSDALPTSLDLTSFQNRQGFANFGAPGHEVRFSVDTLEILDRDTPSEEDAPSDIEFVSYSLNPDGSFTIIWNGDRTFTYELATSHNLSDWTTAAEFTSDTGQFTFTFPAEAMLAERRFFRVCLSKGAP